MTSVDLEEHRVWIDMVNKKLQNIYTQLCEFENLLSDEEDTPKLFELYETMSEIQEHHHSVVEKIKASKESIRDKRKDLQVQMHLLEKSVELLKLETNYKEEGSVGENAMDL